MTETVETTETVTETTETVTEAPTEAAPREPVVIDRPIQTVGRRKEAVVRVRLVPGTGQFHLDGRTLEGIDAHGKHLLFDFGDLVLHSHLGMSGGWHVYERGARWRRPRSSACA